MKVETSTCTKVVISDLMNSEFKLDPVTVYLNDIGPRQGKITIECYGQSWSAYWGGMGERTIAEFFCSCNAHYLAGKLSDIDSNIDDLEGLPAIARQEVISLRKAREINADEARDMYDDASCLEVERADNLHGDLPAGELMRKIFGDEWWHAIPNKPNPDYEYLCQIIRAVQAGLRTMKEDKAA